MSKRKQNYRLHNGDGIPQDLLYSEILSRLPVKSLVRFKSVSRDWKDVISSTGFINLHLQRQQRNSTTPNLLIQALGGESSSKKVGILSLRQGKNMDFELSRVEYCKDRVVHSDIIGSCNGLVCVKDRQVYRMGNRFYIWNPATREQRLIRGQDDETFYHPEYSGFGYDSSSDDYKMLAFGEGKPLGCGSKITPRLFSLKSNQWKTLHESGLSSLLSSRHIYSRNNRVMPIQVGGTLHWILRRSDTILAFDLAKERFSTIPMPMPNPANNAVADINDRYSCLTQVNMCLCVCWMWNLQVWKPPRLLLDYKNISSCCYRGFALDIWVINESKTSWKILYRLTDLDSFIPGYEFESNSFVFEFRDRKGVFILRSAKHLKSLVCIQPYEDDCHRYRVTEVPIIGDGSPFICALVCTESLVSPFFGPKPLTCCDDTEIYLRDWDWSIPPYPPPTNGGTWRKI